MKFYKNKYEYILILIANAALFLCIAFAPHNSKENNTMYESMFHKNNIVKTMNVDQSRVNGTETNNETKKTQAYQQKKLNAVSGKNYRTKSDLYETFSIYSFFNY